MPWRRKRRGTRTDDWLVYGKDFRAEYAGSLHVDTLSIPENTRRATQHLRTCPDLVPAVIDLSEREVLVTTDAGELMFRYNMHRVHSVKTVGTMLMLLTFTHGGGNMAHVFECDQAREFSAATERAFWARYRACRRGDPEPEDQTREPPVVNTPPRPRT